MARVIAREISTPARRSWPTAHGSCPAARCEAPAVAQRCLFPFPTRRSSDLSRSFRALSIWHGSLLGKFRPRLGGVGPRLTARALRLGARPRPWLKATLLPFRSGQSHSFRALSIWHGSLLGKFRPRLGGVGPRLTARALRLGARPRPWLMAGFFLPFAHLVPADHILFGPLIHPPSHGSGVLTPARGEAPATTSLCFQKLQFIWPSTKL